MTFPILPAFPEAATPQFEPQTVHWPCQLASNVNYEQLVTNLLAQPMARRPATLMFTSPGDGDGKTDLLISLAPLLAARAGCRVLLVDANFHKSDLTTRLTILNGGLTDLLLGKSTLNEVVCPTTVPQLSILPYGTHSTSDRGLLDVSALDAVVDDLKCRYPLVLLDAPSLAYPSVATMGSYCDGVCLVVRIGYTLRRAVREATQLIEASGGCLLGCIAIDNV